MAETRPSPGDGQPPAGGADQLESAAACKQLTRAPAGAMKEPKWVKLMTHRFTAGNTRQGWMASKAAGGLEGWSIQAEGSTGAAAGEGWAADAGLG